MDNMLFGDVVYPKNKWKSNKIRKLMSIKRKWGSYYRIKENKTWKHKLQKRRRSKRRHLILYANTLKDEEFENIEFIHYTKTQHQNQLKITEHFAKCSKYQYKSGKRQTKKRKTVNVKKKIKSLSNTYHITKKQKKKLQSRNSPIHSSSHGQTTHNDRYSYHHNTLGFQSCSINPSKQGIKNMLKIRCKIFFTQNTAEVPIYKLRCITLDIFHKRRNCYMTSSELIPCTEGQYKQFDADKLFKFEESKKRHFSFLNIAERCYASSKFYHDEMMNSLGNIAWQLTGNDDHDMNKVMKTQTVKQVLIDSIDILLLCDDILNEICVYLGYYNIGTFTVDGVCQYRMNKECNVDDFRYELAHLMVQRLFDMSLIVKTESTMAPCRKH